MVPDVKEDFSLAVKAFCIHRASELEQYFDKINQTEEKLAQSTRDLNEALKNCDDETTKLIRRSIDNAVAAYNKDFDEIYFQIFDDCQNLFMNFYHVDKLLYFEKDNNDENKIRLFDGIFNLLKETKPNNS